MTSITHLLQTMRDKGFQHTGDRIKAHICTLYSVPVLLLINFADRSAEMFSPELVRVSIISCLRSSPSFAVLALFMLFVPVPVARLAISVGFFLSYCCCPSSYISWVFYLIPVARLAISVVFFLSYSCCPSSYIGGVFFILLLLPVKLYRLVFFYLIPVARLVISVFFLSYSCCPSSYIGGGFILFLLPV